MEEEKQEVTVEETAEKDTAQTETVEVAGGGQVAAETAAEPKPRNGLDKFFGITKSGSSFKTEIIAGITTFMAMVYILMVNSGMFAGVIGGADPFGAAYIATAIGAIAGTVFMALLAKMPLAQASGMGINAFIVYTLLDTINPTGLTYANCMLFTLIEGLIFVILTVTGLRAKIFEAIPKAVRYAIPVGIGMFIAFIGMQNAGIIVGKASTLVTFASFNVLDKNNLFAVYDAGVVRGILPAVVAIVGVIATAIMAHKKINGAVLWGVLGSAVLFYIMAGIGYGCGSQGCADIFAAITFDNPIKAFEAWGKDAVGQVFVNGFNFDGYLGMEGHNAGTLIVLLLTTALSMCMLDMFDTIGTLYGACAKGNLLDENGKPIRMERMLLSDAVATCIGAVAGASTVTTFVESSSGVAAGGKTGFTALVTAGCFLLAMFLSPIAKLIPSAATSPALIWVGVLMMTSVTKIEWTDLAAAFVAFATMMVMVLGYSISKGIGAGLIAYVVVTICTGKIKEITIPTWVITVLFLAMFILTT